MLTCNIEGSFNFRYTTLYCSVTMEYDRNGYLNVTAMQAGMDHRSVRPVSDRFIGKFQDTHWNALYGMCIDHDNAQAEMYRDSRRDNTA